jgi:hypothetical protein
MRWLTRSALLLTVILALSATSAYPGTPDFFAPRAGIDRDTALLLDAASGREGAAGRLRARLGRKPAPANAYEDWSFLCGLESHSGHYARAIADCEKAVALNPQGGDASTLTIARLLAHQPPPRANGSARVPVTPGVRVPAAAGAFDGMAMADTGAQISVMMQSVARSAGVKLLGSTGGISSSTTASVEGQIGLIPEVRIGGTFLYNIPVLVMPDAQLTFSHGRETVSLPFVLSVYALAGFGRVAWLDHDRWLALGGAAPTSFAGAVPMIWHPIGIAVPLDGALGRRTAQFDSGTDVSHLYESGIALLSDAERGSVVQARRTIGGIGAVVEQEIRRVPQADLMLAGQPLVLRGVDIAPESKTGEAARLGEDVLQAYSTVVFDFHAMTFSVSP